MTEPLLHVLRTAEADIAAAMRYLDKERPGHGDLFLQRVHQAFDHICRHPEMYQRFRGNIRRVIVHPFDYAVVYRIRAGSLEVVSVMQGRRDPRRWIPPTSDPKG